MIRRQGFKRSLNLVLGLHIDRARAVIEDEDAGLDQQGAGDGDALFLPTGEIGAARLDDTVITIRHRHG